MFKKVVHIVLTFSLISMSVSPVSASTVQECKEDVVAALETVMGMPGRDGLHGYLNQLSDLTSTVLPTYQLIEEVQQLARDARLEMRSICRELEQVGSLNTYYVNAYDLHRCVDLPEIATDSRAQLEPITFCQQKSDELLEVFLESLRQYLLKQSIRTSIEPLVQRMRSLNARLIVLMQDYARMVNNFYTFSFRLGDTITGERD
jgi:hypothetical protein